MPPDSARNPPQKLAESAGRIVANGASAGISRHGTRAVGVDAVIGAAGIAKMTLDRTAASKIEEGRWQSPSRDLEGG